MLSLYFLLLSSLFYLNKKLKKLFSICFNVFFNNLILKIILYIYIIQIKKLYIINYQIILLNIK